MQVVEGRRQLRFCGLRQDCGLGTHKILAQFDFPTVVDRT